MISLDELDYRIVQLLQEDARMSSREMTSRLGDVSDRVVRYRIRRLVDRRVVFLQAMVSPRQVGYPVIADVLIEVAPRKLTETCAKLVEMEAVASVNSSRAGRHLSIQVNARNVGELAAFVKQTLPQIDGIVGADAAVVPRLIKDLAFWRPPAAAALGPGQARQRPRAAALVGRQPLVAREALALCPDPDHAAAERSPVRRVPRSFDRTTGPSDSRKRRASSVGRRRSDAHEQDLEQVPGTRLDDLDRQIIKLSQKDPRMSSRDMTCRLGDVSDRVVRYRIRRLLDRHVLVVQARVNPHEVGYPIVADMLIKVVPWKLADACAALTGMELVCYVSAAHAGRDGCELSIEVNARNEGELAAFVKNKLRLIDGIVSSHAMVVPHLAKDVAVWEIPRAL